jgi:hypothetical protein
MLPRFTTSLEGTMAIVGLFQDPSMTQERYEQSVSGLTGRKSRMEAPADWPVEGIAHTFVSA